MKIKVFTPNERGKIEFTREELEKLLNDTYAEGQRNCNCGSNITWTNPYITPYVSTNESKTNPYTVTATFNSNDAKEMSRRVDEIINGATAKINNDAFSKLAKELNF